MRHRVRRALPAFLACLALLACTLAGAPPARAAGQIKVGVDVADGVALIGAANYSAAPATNCRIAVFDDWNEVHWATPTFNLGVGDHVEYPNVAIPRGFWVLGAACDDDEADGTGWFTSLTPDFVDVGSTEQFFTEITWLHAEEIATGYDDGTFRTLDPVNRDALAAYLYRMAGRPEVTLPSESPFADIGPDTAFYREMVWMHATGLSTGWTEDDGTVTYRPVQPVNRDAMAAFLYRFYHQVQFPDAEEPAPPTTSPFNDVSTETQFFAQMAWLHGNRIATGWRNPDGTVSFRPVSPIARDAMAAFLFRLHWKEVADSEPAPERGAAASGATLGRAAASPTR